MANPPESKFASWTGRREGDGHVVRIKPTGALKREQLVSFAENLRGVVPDDVAEAIARDRFEGRPELLEECLRALDRAATEPH